MDKKLIIIDGNSVFYRSFYALPLLTNINGEYSNAIYGFANSIIKIITEMKPTHIVVAFDVSKHTFRNEIFSDYKATRAPMPAELASQIAGLKEMLSAMGIKMLEKEGLEADDIIGTIAKRFDVPTVIVTGDRDSFQLVDGSTSVCFMRKGVSEFILMTDKNLKKEYGVEPWQVVDLKALQGDTADNIPGVAGVGPKTATMLIEKYGSLDNVYAHIDEIAGKLGERLKESKEMAYLSQKLATINTAVDVKCALEDCTFDYPFNAKVKEIFERFSFRSLLKRPELFRAGGIPESDLIESDSKNLVKIDTVEFNSIDKLNEILQENKGKPIAIFEDENGQVHLSFGEVEYISRAMASLIDAGVSAGEVYCALRDVLKNDETLKIFYDTKHMLHRFDEVGVSCSRNIFDVAVAANVSFGVVIKSVDDICELFKFDKETIAAGLVYAQREAAEKVEKTGTTKCVYEIEFPLIFTLFAMEKRGFKVDRTRLDELTQEYAKRIDSLQAQIYREVGHEFNINSPKQLSAVLFDELNLPKANKKASTSAEILEKLGDLHPVVPIILEYRKASKFYGTYLAGMIEHIDPDGFVRTRFNQTLTATGRLSSSEPNLQNLPIRSDEGRAIRSIFTASGEDRILIDVDYSQIELRVLAHFSGDDGYILAFSNNEDIHTRTASEVFGLPMPLITPQMRRVAKVVNFGVVYGMSEFGLSQDLGIRTKDAREYIEKFYNSHPKIDKFMSSEISKCKERGYSETLFGRRRAIPDINTSNFMVRSRAERTAQNMAIQGTASEIIKVAMNNVEKEIEKAGLDAKLIMQVHDELVIDCAKKDAAKVKALVEYEMDNAVKLRVPLEVDASEAFRWGDAH